jgi:hypothetical protein
MARVAVVLQTFFNAFLWRFKFFLKKIEEIKLKGLENLQLLRQSFTSMRKESPKSYSALKLESDDFPISIKIFFIRAVLCPINLLP